MYQMNLTYATCQPVQSQVVIPRKSIGIVFHSAQGYRKLHLRIQCHRHRRYPHHHGFVNKYTHSNVIIRWHEITGHRYFSDCPASLAVVQCRNKR